MIRPDWSVAFGALCRNHMFHVSLHERAAALCISSGKWVYIGALIPESYRRHFSDAWRSGLRALIDD